MRIVERLSPSRQAATWRMRDFHARAVTLASHPNSFSTIGKRATGAFEMELARCVD